jgi:glucose-1-phosphate thymidylyltransferase
MTAAVFSNKVVRRRAITFSVLLAASFVLMAISSSPIVVELQKGVAYAFSPVQGVLDDTAAGVASIFRTISEIDTLRQENASLQDENDRLRIENARSEETKRENDLLTGLLQLQAGLDHETVAASVIAREPAEFRRAVTIDRGSDHGIAQGDVVIGAGGALVGRVVEVGPNYGNVTLLTDGSSTVIGQLVSNGATGEVVGDLAGALNMTKVDSSVPVQLGDEVVSSTSGATPTTSYRPRSWSPVRRSTGSNTCSSSRTTRAVCLSPTSSRSTATPRARKAPCPRVSNRASPRRRSDLAALVHDRASPRRRSDLAALVHDREPLVPFSAMKGIVLAGGTATRLFPLTIVTNKHLLPIYDRPMIYYPIETLASMGIREVMVVVGGKSVGDVVELLGDGSHFGLDLTYRYQGGPLGIAHAIGLARGFIGDDAFCCVLGDNILRGPALADVAAEFESGTWGAGTLLYRVADPERFGVAETDDDGRVIGFEEKPASPKSDLIPIGVYFLRPDAFDVIDRLAPSGRGEFEITDVLNHYIPDGRLYAPLYEGHWTDAGTVPSLLRAAELAAEDHANGRLVAPRERPIV